MFEYDGDDYDFERMIVTSLRGFYFYKYELKVINNNLFRSQVAIKHKHHDTDMVKILCPPAVQHAYQEYLAEKELLEL